jgi:aminoglycoside 6-adenylyltransferase
MSGNRDDVINTLIKWAEQKNSIRAMLLTSTRAVPGAAVDVLSDYDVVLVVEDIHPFYEDRGWLHDFGNVLVAYWDPIYPDPDFGFEKFGNVTEYGDKLKIDFTLLPVELFQHMVQAPQLPAEYDAGYRILLDKDNVTTAMKPPTYRGYIPLRPTNDIYQKLINDFFSDVPYVAKCLWRDELLPAKWCLDYDMKHVHLRPMLEWKVGLDTDWSVAVGSLGKGLKKRLSSEVWSQVENTYAGADIIENWTALYRTIDLFRQIAVEVGQRLGYTYPYELDQRVTDYAKQIQRWK